MKLIQISKFDSQVSQGQLFMIGFGIGTDKSVSVELNPEWLLSKQECLITQEPLKTIDLRRVMIIESIFKIYQQYDLQIPGSRFQILWSKYLHYLDQGIFPGKAIEIVESLVSLLTDGNEKKSKEHFCQLLQEHLSLQG